MDFAEKRANDDNDNGSETFKRAKRRRGQEDTIDDMEIRLLIPSVAAGVVIGHSGSNIKRLRSEFTATVIIPDSNAPERVVVVAASVEDVCKVAKEIMILVDEAVNNKTKETYLKVFVHQSRVGGVIGQNGSKIREIREKAGISLRVFPEKAPHSTDRIAYFTGESGNIITALRDMLTICCEIQISGDNRPYDTINYDPALVHTYGGFAPTRPWRDNKKSGGAKTDTYTSTTSVDFNPQQNSLMNSLFSYPAVNIDQQSVSPLMTSLMSGFSTPNYDISKPVSLLDASYQTPSLLSLSISPLDGMNVTPPLPGPGSDRNKAIPSIFNLNSTCATSRSESSTPVISLMEFLGEEETKTIRVSVPKDLAGSIIGKGGSRIFRIREDSGAHVSVEAPEEGSDERIVVITGSQKALEKAQYLMQQCIRSSSSGRKFIQEQAAKKSKTA